MNSRPPFAFDRQRIVVADEDSVTSASIISALRRDGHCVALEPSALTTDDFPALTRCHLVISSLRIEGTLRSDRLRELQERLPALPVLYLADGDPDAAALEMTLLPAVATLRTPFTTAELQAAVRRLLPGLSSGSMLARQLESPVGGRASPLPFKPQRADQEAVFRAPL